jgi:predicted secreted protein
MPCPEHAFLGMHRFWLVKDQADTLAFRRHCRRQAKVVAGAIAVHVERGTDVVVIGVEGSPSMGVRITSSSAEWGGRPDKGDDDYPLVPGRGIFSEELVAELAERGLGDVRASGIEHQLPTYDEAAERERISALLEHPSGR